MSIEEAGAIIGNSISNNDQSTEFAEPAATTTNYQVNLYNFVVRQTQIRIRNRTIGDAFILGSSTHGVLGTDKLGTGSMGGWTTDVNQVINAPIADSGKNQLAVWLNSNSEATPNAPLYLGFGTDTTAASTSDSDLNAEVDSRSLVNPSNIGTGTAKRVEYTWYMTDAHVTDGRVIGEFGIFDASSSGNLYLRYVPSSVITFDEDKQWEVFMRFDLTDNTTGNAIMPTVGLNAIRNFMANNAGDPPTHAEWTDGTTALAVGDTTLTGSATSVTNAFTTQSRSNNRVTYESVLTVTQLNSVDITKTGVFNAVSSGTLFAEKLSSAIAKTTTFDVRNFDIITVL